MALEGSNFKIYSASAGSGKTYALTKEYLKLLLANDYPLKFRQILAITFTNKAVNEMKTRILDNLQGFGTDQVPKKQESLFQELCQELALSAEQLRTRSKLILKRILHNYSFFEISTIDKFNHKIIKTFARDLHLSQNFEVELDLDLLLEEAVGRLLERAGNDEELTEVLITFSLEKIDDDKSWDITRDLIEMGKLLFQENHAEHVEPLKSKSIGDFQDIQKNMALQMQKIGSSIKMDAEKALLEIESQGFDFADFPRQTLPNHFIKLKEGEVQPDKLYANKLEQNLTESNILKASDKRDVSSLAGTLLHLYLKIKELVYQHAYLKNVYGNIVPMTVLNEIAKEIKNIELDKDIIPISSLNAILSKEIKDQPVPFIYERMGEKYRHYFIDEFQDTSKMQWDNLVPLIGNALESENERNEQGSLFLVGDVKQAIYRWRGGKAEQFLDLMNGKSHPFVVEPNIHSLGINWRSRDEIVGFNNAFFTTVSPVFENEDYKKLFLKDSHQKTNNNPGGFVQLTFLDKDSEEKEQVHCDLVLETIQQILYEKYVYADICILVRDNKNGMLLANFLAKNNIPIISSDALLLAHNDKVAFLIAILRICENTNDREAAFQILMYLSKGEKDIHGFISEHMDQMERFLALEYGFAISKWRGQSVFTLLEKAIAQFNLTEGSIAHITFLMDEVLDVEKRKGPSVHAFLNYWEIKKSTLSIAAPDDVNAVRIMTVHKAKGLEFPFVIFPFATSSLKKPSSKLWVPATEKEKDLGLDAFLVNTKKNMLEYNPIAAAIYSDEEQKSVLDAMNVLYVALTRPVIGLFIFTEKGKDAIRIEEAQTYSDLFQEYLKSKGLYQEERHTYSFGSFPKNLDSQLQHEADENHITYITRPKGDTGFTISTKSGRLWDDERIEAIEMGNVIHFALSQIKYTDDVPQVIENLQLDGYFSKDAAKDMEEKLLEVVHHPQLKDFFKENQQVLNEQEILTSTGISLRPDRIMISEKQATILDYKTGKPSPSHKEQIMQYADVLKEMDYEIKHVIIVYIDQKIEPVFV